MNSDLNHVVELLRRETGIAIRSEQLASLEVALARVEPGMDASRFLAARVDPARGGALLSRLIDEVTVRETFFLRQRDELETVAWESLLASAKAAGRDRVGVWVAGCASGEEAYSLALLACEAFDTGAPPVSILATDISHAALASARRGSFGRRSARALDETARQRYFTADGERLNVGPGLRALITFEHHNLVGDQIPPGGAGRFDLVACRNVLIYFDDEAIERVVHSLGRALAADGMLLLGAADRLCGSARRLTRLEHLPTRLRRSGRPLRERTRARAREVEPAKIAEIKSPPARAGDPRSAELKDVLRAADAGDLELAIETAARIVRANPLDCDAHFIRGLAELGLGDADAAAQSFRRVLYIDPTFGLAAFKLGRAHEACGDRASAYRAYEHALRSPRAGDGGHSLVLEHVDLDDVAAACAIRLRALGGERASVAAAGRPL